MKLFNNYVVNYLLYHNTIEYLKVLLSLRLVLEALKYAI